MGIMLQTLRYRFCDVALSSPSDGLPYSSSICTLLGFGHGHLVCRRIVANHCFCISVHSVFASFATFFSPLPYCILM